MVNLILHDSRLEYSSPHEDGDATSLSNGGWADQVRLKERITLRADETDILLGTSRNSTNLQVKFVKYCAFRNKAFYEL